MSKDPAFLFYTSDFLTGVIDMSMKERGQYITLLCLQHQRGHLTMKEIVKTVGKPSEEVLGKFELDGEGKYFNVRADKEIAKRDAHCQKQRENINKRWNNNGNTDAIPRYTENSGGGEYQGITTVIPLENENVVVDKRDIENYDEKVGTGTKGTGVPGENPELGKVMTLYMDKVCASPSSGSMQELIAYTGTMGADVVCHAVNIAVDAGKRSWSYVRGILRSYAAAGVKSLDAVQRMEQEHDRQAAAKSVKKVTCAADYVPPKTDPAALKLLKNRMGKGGSEC
jgi:DnaD/phage-associated family protein